MRIGELNFDCSKCTLTAYCGSSKPLQLCTITALQNVNDVFYRKLAEGLSAADIEHKLRQYDMVQESPVDREEKCLWAVCDVILDKMHL